MLSSILIGYGHAARDFHLPALRRMHAVGGPARIGVADPLVLVPGAVRAPPDLLLAADLAELAPRFDSERTVVHVCTPPDAHAAALRQCAALGFKYVLAEKPLVTTYADLAEVEELARQRELDILVVSNWLSSRLTEAVGDALAGARADSVERITLRSSKPRIGRSLASATHRSAFDVEMPHLVALAMRLCRSPLSLQDAWCSDLVVPGRRVAMMGAADMVLRSAAGHDVRLATNLLSPRRERSVFVRWKDGTRLAGNFPCDSTDVYSQLQLVAPDGELREHRVFEDETVQAFFDSAYMYFEHGEPRPASDLELHAAVTHLLVDARSRCEASAAFLADAGGVRV